MHCAVAHVERERNKLGVYFPFSSLSFSPVLFIFISMAQPNEEFFPTIGKLANKTDLLPDREYQLPSQDDQNEDRPLEEIESLCMSCNEQVSMTSRSC